MFFGRREDAIEMARLRRANDDLTALARRTSERERELQMDLVKERTAREAADRVLTITQNNFEWARVRLNQVEQERAALIQTLLKAPIGALEIERRLTPDTGHGLPFALPDGLFDDVGDDAARDLGLDEVPSA